eukprot:2620986-Ditylum_brightwellii.AAC.1
MKTQDIILCPYTQEKKYTTINEEEGQPLLTDKYPMFEWAPIIPIKDDEQFEDSDNKEDEDGHEYL